MRAVKAIVVSVNKKTGIEVKLDSGFSAMIPYTPVCIGQSILVGFDHVKNHVIRIINKYKGEGLLEIIEIAEDGEDRELENPEEIELELSNMEGDNHEEDYASNNNSDDYVNTICYFSQ